MNIPSTKKVVCITGSVWTGSRSAPRRMLIKDGFLRPSWFTTDRRLTDADYGHISETEFHLANAEQRVLAYIEYAGSFIGVMREDFESAAATAERGVLIVGPPEIAAQFAAVVPQIIVFALKDVEMQLSKHLEEAKRAGQLHRIDVDVLAPGAWTEVYRSMMAVMGLPVRGIPF